YVEEIKPAGVRVNVSIEDHTAKAYKVDPNHPLIQKAAQWYEKAFNEKTIFIRMGGSIPVVEKLDEIYNIKVILLGFGTPEDRLQSPNESFPLDSFTKGMETLVYYWTEVAK